MSALPSSALTRTQSSVLVWVVFGVTLLAEYLAVSFLLDAKDILNLAGLNATRIGDLVPLIFLVIAAMLLTGGSAIRLRLRALSAYRSERSRLIGFGVAHLLLFCTTLVLGLALKSTTTMNITLARFSVVLWFIVALSSCALLVFTLWSRALVHQTFRGLYRELGFGLLVGGLAWASGMVARLLWEPLAWLTLELVHALLTVMVSDPVASIEHALVGTSRFYVNVAPVCSGIEGVGLMLIFVGAYLYVERRELLWPRSLIVLPLSALGVWLLNVVRITALIAVGTWFSPEVALGGFHSKAGWVFFTLSALGVVFWVQHSRQFRRAVAPLPPPAAQTPSVQELEPQSLATNSDQATATLAYLSPLLAVIATKMLTGLTTSGFDYLYPLSVVAALILLSRFRAHYPRPDWSAPAMPLGVGLAVGAVWIIGFSEADSASILKAGLAALSPAMVALWLMARAFGTIVTVPIVEELAFRGFLLRRFVAADFSAVSYRTWSWLGLIVSSVAFGLLHSQWGLGIFAGLVFGALTMIRGRLSDAVIAHSAANALIVVFVFLSGRWALLA